MLPLKGLGYRYEVRIKADQPDWTVVGSAATLEYAMRMAGNFRRFAQVEIFDRQQDRVVVILGNGAGRAP